MLEFVSQQFVNILLDSQYLIFEIGNAYTMY